MVRPGAGTGGKEIFNLRNLSVSVAAKGQDERRAWTDLLQEPPCMLAGHREFDSLRALGDAQEGGWRSELLIVDCSLMAAEGLDSLSRVLRGAEGGAVVLLCSPEEEALALKGIESGAKDYLFKGEVAASELRRTALYAVERSRAGVAERKHEERYEDLFESNPLPMLVYELETLRILAINQAGLRHLRYTREEVLQLTLRDFHPAEDLPRLEANIAQVTKGRDEAGIWRHRRKDGSYASVEIVSHTMRFNGRRAEIVLIHDVTETLAAQERSARSAALLRMAGEKARLGGWHVVLKDGCVIMSDETAAIHGEAPGFTPSMEEAIEYYAPEYRPGIWEAFDACVARGAPFDLELQIINKSSQRVWVRAIGEAVRDEAGQITGVQGAFQDISRQKADQIEVRQLANRLSKILESITDAFFTLDRRWGITYVNAEAERLLRCKRADLLGRSLWEAFPETIGSRFEAEYRTAMEAEATVGFEEYFTPLGIWVDVRAYPSEEGLAVYFRDVTRRRQHEQLRAGETRILEMILGETALPETLEAVAQLADGVATGIKTTILLLDENGEQLRLGAAPSMPSGFPSLVDGLAVGPQAGSCGVGAFSRKTVLVSDIRTDPRWACCREDAVELGLRASWSWPVFDAGGNPVATVALYRAEPGLPDEWALELADRLVHLVSIAVDSFRRAEALRKSESRLREHATLLDKATDAILVCDLANKVLFWNKSAQQLYGWSVEEVLDRPVTEFIYDQPSEFLRAAEAVLKQGEWNGEIHQRTKSGARLIVEGRWTLVRNDSGEPTSVLVINTDITERKKLEQQFLRAQRMESIGTLAGGIAHDLNNVLSPIMMAMDLLKLRLKDSAALDLLENIRNNARRGAEMVSQVLSFARGVEGRRVEMQLRHLISDVHKIAADTFPKNITIRSHCPRDLWTIEGDPTQIHQVLLNLCVNARDAMPEGGVLRISVTNKFFEEKLGGRDFAMEPGPYVRVEVEDTGTGIPGDVIDKIFDPFFTTKEIGKGTGLGLSTALSIIRSHAGFIRTESTSGRGTCFRVYLPACGRVGNDEEATEAEVLPRGNGETVLVVDDEAAVRAIACQTLETFGYKVLLASDGAEGVACYAAQRDSIDVVLTDLMMPVMDGPGMIRVLSRLDPDVRIIATSGIAAGKRPAVLSDLKVQHFLPKPFSAEVLLQTLQVVLHGEPARGAGKRIRASAPKENGSERV